MAATMTDTTSSSSGQQPGSSTDSSTGTATGPTPAAPGGPAGAVAAFVVGAWLGLAHIEGRLLEMPRSVIVPLMAIALAGLAEGFWLDRGIVEDETAFLGFLAFAVAITALFVGVEARLPRLQWLERLGDASYSIYLVHIFAVGAFAGLVLKLLGPGDTFVVAGAVTLAILGGLALGWACYAMIEKPLMTRLRRFA